MIRLFWHKLLHIKNLIKNIQTKHTNKAIILAYHRVFSPKADPQLLCTTPEHFEQQLKIIKDYYNPISLSNLSLALEKRKIPNRSIVITFDDGYIDNLLFAKPLLETYQIPATIFITTNYLNQDKEPWWDDIERIILLPKKLPKTLHLSINNKNYSWSLNEQENINLKKWDVTQLIPNNRYQLYLDLHKLLKPISSIERDNLLQELSQWASLPPDAREFYRIVTTKELIELNESPYIEIGSHTITHPQLSAQTEFDQTKEIKDSKKTLESILKNSITSFSYPFGTPCDIGEQAPHLVQKNYTIATANFPGYITKKTNRFQLPRHLVRNWTGTLFHTNLKKWFYE